MKEEEELSLYFSFDCAFFRREEETSYTHRALLYDTQDSTRNRNRELSRGSLLVHSWDGRWGVGRLFWFGDGGVRFVELLCVVIFCGWYGTDGWVMWIRGNWLYSI